MKRLQQRILTLWLILLALCTAVVLIPRLNPAPDRLEALGLETCDGDLCWRGIRPGMDWATARRVFPGALVGDYAVGQPYLTVNLRSGRFANIYSDGMSVSRVNLWGRWLSVTLSEVLLRYGPPHCVEVVGYTGVNVFEIGMIYPSLRVGVQVPVRYDRSRSRYVFQLTENVPVLELQFTAHADAICVARESRFVFPWRGFQVKAIR